MLVFRLHQACSGAPQLLHGPAVLDHVCFVSQDRLEKKSFFNWFYFAINWGSCLAVTVVVYVQDSISWAIGFAIPTVAMAVAITTFTAGSSLYTHVEPTERCFLIWHIAQQSQNTIQPCVEPDGHLLCTCGRQYSWLVYPKPPVNAGSLAFACRRTPCISRTHLQSPYNSYELVLPDAHCKFSQKALCGAVR